MKIAVIGAGNMGLAFSNAFILKGVLKAEDLLMVEARSEAHIHLRSQGFYRISSEADHQINDCQVVILAVKPQDFKSMAINLRPNLKADHILLSIMAGISIETISTALGHQKIVRSMPNTPAKLGVGITGYYADHLTEYELETVITLLECTGIALKLEKESQLNAVTALSGSGPAYFYYFLRAMVKAGQTLGLSEETARKLACETMNGSYQLIQSSNATFDELIKAVTSKGGTTEAALHTFETFRLDECIQSGILKAEQRANELSL